MMMSLSNIPDELKRLKNWCLYRLEKRGDKLTKIPINAYDGSYARSNDKSTWNTFDMAVKSIDNFECNGVGFFFEPPYFGVDIDNVGSDIEEFMQGNNDNLIGKFLNTLNSYSEFSRSKNGIHIICKGTLPTGGRRKNNVEMYQNGRFFVMTGYQIGDTKDIRDCTNEIKFLHSKYIGQKDITESNKAVYNFTSDTKIMDAIKKSKNSANFFNLYNGNWQGSYPSQSEADMALCSMLAFWTAKNEKQMDKLFRASALYRPKWDSLRGALTYGQKTILEAVNGCTNVYEHTDDDFQIFVNQDGPKEIEKFGYDDTGNADRLLNLYSEDIRYSHINKIWYYYNSNRWIADNTGKMKILAEIAIEKMKEEFALCNTEDEEKSLLKHIKSTRSNKGKENMIKECMHRVPILPHELDSHNNLFNCVNGYIDINDGKLYSHDRYKFFTKMSNVEFTDKIDCPMWEKFLDEIFAGNKELIRFIQKAIGYSLTGYTKEQCMFVLFGSGLNGKSVFLDIINDIMGDYAMNIQPQTLMVKQYGNNNGANSDIARIKGARFVTTVEPDEGMRFAEGLIKQLTGGDKVTARHLYKEEFEFIPEFKIWLATNHKPIIRGNDDGIWRRIHLIPFNVKIPKNKIDKNLKYKLRTELTGILNWAVNGALMWKEEGLEPPTIVQKETYEYRKEMDVITLFIDECCILDAKAEVKTNEIYKAYKDWAIENNQYVMSSTKFGRELGSKFEKRKIMGVRIYKGIKVLREFESYQLSVGEF